MKLRMSDDAEELLARILADSDAHSPDRQFTEICRHLAELRAAAHDNEEVLFRRAGECDDAGLIDAAIDLREIAGAGETFDRYHARRNAERAAASEKAP